MTDHYMKELLRVAVAQICQTIGYNATQTAPLELLQDVLDKFLREFTRDLRRQVEHYNRTDSNLNDVTLTLNSINVNLNELLDYINNVEPVPFALEVPKFPAHKNSALNFLKPGSKEVLTRPVHVHDHLPPMLPPENTPPPEPALTAVTSNGITDSKENLISNTNGEQSNEISNKSVNTAVLDKTTLQSLFKPSTNFEDGERPTREVSSVVMTTGGYISPAVEGKMPEAIVPDIIDKLLGLDAPPPPPPPPPPPQPIPAARASNNTPGPSNDNSSNPLEKQSLEKDLSLPSTSKETKKALARQLEPQPVSHRKLEDMPYKKNKLFNNAANKNYAHEPHLQPLSSFNKKSFMMHQNAANLQTPQTNYANMLLKKAKKQKQPLMPGQPLAEKHNKPMAEKLGKMDNNDKAQRKYMKMLQKMAKQGKIPPELLSNIMGPDKKSKMINPAIVASMPPGPEKIQLEKLMRKQAKQRQKMLKQQMMLEMQKQTKKPMLQQQQQQQPPPLVPIFPPQMPQGLNQPLTKPLELQMEEQKLKMEQKNLANLSPHKPAFPSNLVSPSNNSNTNMMPLQENLLNKNQKTVDLGDSAPIEIMDNGNNLKPMLSSDGKDLKLNNEPDRSKLNIFKKISKQKTPKSSSPTPMRLPGMSETPIINLPSGTTITPAPGPGTNPANIQQNPVNTTPVGRNLFPPLNDNSNNNLNNNSSSNIINVDEIKDKPPIISGLQPQQATDLTMLNRVFGEKPAEMELVNKPKKRGRKPGSKNSPKIPGVFPNNLLKKTSKKFKMDNSNIFPLDITKPNALPGNVTLDNMAQLFGNSLEWAQQKQLQQQLMMMSTAKERKEYKKKAKMLKQDFLQASDNNNPNITNLNKLTNSALTGVAPTSEEVQSINKKLMRMDTILKAAPSTNTHSPDLSVDTSLITGKKLPSPSMFPGSSTSPLKSPGNSKRLLSGSEALSNSLVQSFMMPQRPAFPNLPTNMLSMLPFPFPPRPGLIPTPGLFPTPGLGAFPNNPKNPLLSGLFPFPNLKQPMMGDNTAMNQDSEDLTTDKKKSDSNLQTSERSYCNVAPLVPDFLTKLNDPTANNPNSNNASSNNKHTHEPPHAHEPDLPKTPKPRNSHTNTLSQDNLLKKMVDAHTPESAAGSLSGKSIPSTPGGMSLNTFEQLMKKNDQSPMDLIPLGKHNKTLMGSQESCLDFSMNKKSNSGGSMGTGIMGSGISVKTPITLNNEPIEVSDDSDETNQPQPMPLSKTQIQHSPSLNMAGHLANQTQTHSNFNMDDMFVANTSSNNPTQMLAKSMESDLSSKELKKLKKQVKKSSSNITAASLMNADKTELNAVATTSTTASAGVGKLAGGADLIPLTSTGMAYSSKNIPFNSLTANANPSFSVHKTDFTGNTVTPSSSSSSATATTVKGATSSVFDNLTITTAIPSSSSVNSTSHTAAFDLQKKRKEHKKLKKLKELKEGKIKKKKDKKDKNKEKEKDKVKKYLLNETHTSTIKEKETSNTNVIDLINTNPVQTAAAPPPTPLQPVTINPVSVTPHSATSVCMEKEKLKDKDLIKKLKKEKKKEKQRTAMEDLTTHNHLTSQQHTSTASHNTSSIHKDNVAISNPGSMLSIETDLPKKQKLSPALSIITSEHKDLVNLSSSSAQPSPSLVPKLTLKLGNTHSPTPPRDDSHKTSSSKIAESSTSLAQQTTLNTSNSSPTRERNREPSPELARISPLVTRPPKHKLNTSNELPASTTTPSANISSANTSTLDITGDQTKSSSTSSSNIIVPPPSPWLSGGTISASSVLLPHQLLQSTKQHDISSTPATTSHSTDNSSKNSNNDRQSPLTLITETSRPSSYIDAEGNRVWICPACGKVDDGSPMIGCDGCDAWYHWLCVGIVIAPKDNEDWFCRVCITRKKGIHGSDKKRKRNKKK